MRINNVCFRLQNINSRSGHFRSSAVSTGTVTFGENPIVRKPEEIKKILVVDDEKMYRDIHTEKLKDIFGDELEVVCARDAIEALGALKYDDKLPDFIITDLQMPGGSVHI